MNWAWAASLDRIWSSPAFPMWLTVAAAAFFAIILFITLLRADKSVANGALTVIALLAIGISVATGIRGSVPDGRLAYADIRSSPPISPALPALSCIDDLAGDAVLTACEKSLFASAESVAAAVSYAAAQITRLTELGDAVADKSMTPQLQRLRRVIERDRYGLMAQVLVTRDRCRPTACPAFRALTDTRQIMANMDDRVYDGLIARYAPSWNASAAPPPPATQTPGPVAALPPGVPTGKPTNADFPTAASTPPVSIMTPEPVAGQAAPRLPASSPADNARLLSPRPTASSVAPAQAPAKKQAVPKPLRAAAPVQLGPATPAAGAPAPGAPAPGERAPAAANESSFQKP
jgi:hypothetical protein